MAENIKGSLCNHLRTSQFSIQLDESTLPTNEALLLSYVRFIKDEKICEKLLFARNLETDTKGEFIFNTLEKFCDEKEIPLKNIISVATDGASAMTGCHKGSIAYLKNKIPDVLAVHCVIHRQHLLCVTNDKDFNRLLFHTEVRWLSRGNCLTRFYNLFDSVIDFLETKDTELRNKLITSKNDIAYMTDLYKLFNDMNLQLQGDELNLFKTKNVVAAFAAKLLLNKKNMGRREFHSFPNLSVSCSNDDLLAYYQHLENLHIDFTERYQDILKLEIPDWIAFPSSYLCERGYSAVATLLTKKRNRLHVTKRGNLPLFLSKWEPDINKLIKQHQIHPSH
ncbi:hypothetical protein K1T71_005616 [Dendrolimus kikuchii]|uniref:Uncharacterized protein n=1 Tax=Dendrolimus kikuchii TaxID=765133 RepID=A0ACC1D4Q5_9NEOP|nr:hypothetical protein K1T71_005616 [Dendrolimus kikuchii]